MRTGALLLAVTMGAGAALAAACMPATAPDGEPIAAVHRTQCGRCHGLPSPHHLARGYVEDTFVRHRGRVHLSDEEWGAMVNYMADASAMLGSRSGSATKPETQTQAQAQ